MSTVTTKQSETETIKQSVDLIKSKAHLAQLAFEGLSVYYDTHLNNHLTASVGRLLDEIAELMNDLAICVNKSHLDSGDSLLSTMTTLLHLANAGEIDHEWVRQAKSRLCILNYVAGNEGAHNPDVGELADMWQAYMEVRGVKLDPTDLEANQKLRTATAVAM